MVTVTSTVPARSAGLVAVIEVAESAVTVPLAVPNFTLWASAKLTPVMTTAVPPSRGPEAGSMEVTTGAGE